MFYFIRFTVLWIGLLAGISHAGVIALLTGEHEYHTEESLRAFAKAELEPLGHRIVYVAAPVAEGAGEFENIAALKEADLIIVSVRRRAPQAELIEILREHLKAGKALIGIRTASHAFQLKTGEPEPGHAAWPAFDTEVLGAHYAGHWSAKLPDPFVGVVTENAGHPILAGLKPEEFRVGTHLYKYEGLAADTTLLLRGHVEGETKLEPVAWVRTVGSSSKIFYTSLGGVRDFELPAFRRLLTNAVAWTLEKPATR
jgi:type 1 glutamine amidotransferase